MRLPFTKMHGIGNDYVYVNTFEHHVADPAAVARQVSPRHTGIGSDGLILIGPSAAADCRMEMYNADGSRGEMCGNGIRCVGKFAWEHGLLTTATPMVETDAGIRALQLEIRDGSVSRVTVDMGEPSLSPDDIPLATTEEIVDGGLEINGVEYRITCVSVGNPHCVLFVDSTEDAPVHSLGPLIETHPLFPRRTNVEFVQLLGESPCERLRMRVWERGSGETAACGTGACAAAVASILTGRSKRQVVVELVGGDLEIEWRSDDNRVRMAGGATEVFSGEIEL